MAMAAEGFSDPRFEWHEDDFRGLTWSIALFCLVLSVSSLVARLFYRQYARALNIDDVPAVALLVFVVAYGALEMALASRGLGLTMENVLPANRSYVSAGVFANCILFFVATACSNLSLALTCKLTVLDDKRNRSRYFRILPIAIAAIVLMGIIWIAAVFRPQEMDSADIGQFTSLRTTFVVFLTLSSILDLCVVGMMGFEVARLQMSARSKNRVFSILIPRFGTIPVSAFMCRAIEPQLLAKDFSLQVWPLASFLSLSLLISCLTTSIIAMGASLEGFDIRAQTDFAMSTMHSRPSLGNTKFSHANSMLNSSAYDRTTKIDGGDASSDQMPILPEDSDKDGGIYVSRTVEHAEERAR